MKKSKKEFDYRGYKFYIEVEKEESNDEPVYTVTTKCIYFNKRWEQDKVGSQSLEMCILKAEKLAKKYIDKKKERGRDERFKFSQEIEDKIYEDSKTLKAAYIMEKYGCKYSDIINIKVRQGYYDKNKKK